MRRLLLGCTAIFFCVGAPLIGQTTPGYRGANIGAEYATGTILGYKVRRDTVEKSTRLAKVYELRGTNLLYLIDYCGSFQAGKFSPGEIVKYRVDSGDDRLYILHDGNKEYGCQLEGMRLIPSAAGEGPQKTVASAH